MAHLQMPDVYYVNEGNITHQLNFLYSFEHLNHLRFDSKLQGLLLYIHGSTRPGLLLLIFDSPCFVIPRPMPNLSDTSYVAKSDNIDLESLEALLQNWFYHPLRNSQRQHSSCRLLYLLLQVQGHQPAKPTISFVSPVTLSLVATVCSLSKYAAVKLKPSLRATFTPTSVLSYTSGSKCRTAC